MSRLAIFFCLLAGHVILCLANRVNAADAEQLIGNPTAIEVQPPAIQLDGPRGAQQLLVTGRYADGSRRDLTRFCEFQVLGTDEITVTPRGRVTATRDGTAQIEIRVAGHAARLPIAVANAQQSQPVSFRHEVMPVLSVAGCSDIRCHGAPSGKNGFRLSLWGSEPKLDYQQLTRDAYGRRTDSLRPDNSLILLKALTQVSHAGGQRFSPESSLAAYLRAWQTEGLRDDPPGCELQALAIFPANRVLHAPARGQQLSVRATFDDGRTADVTHLTTFSSSDLAVADVDRNGLVEFRRRGEVAILCRFLGHLESVRLMYVASPPANYAWPNPPEHNFVDRHVFAKLRLLHIPPSELCADEQFVRRLYLDLCGVLPTPEETRSFVSETAADKRAQLADQLLQRQEHADYWTKKWLDVLRSSRDSIQLAGASAYQAWLRDQLERDVSVAEIVQTLLTSLGESYRDPAVNFFCAPPMPREASDPSYLQKDLAEATAQLFLGIRLQCAQCHNHPYERWTQDDYLGLAAFFTQLKRSRLGEAGPQGRPDRRQIAVALDLTAVELTNPATEEAVAPHFPGQPPEAADPQRDRRQLLAEWLTRPSNPFFAKAVVNRVWFHLHGRGIVEPVDDFRDSNPPANDALLNALAQDFAEHGFRLKHLIRTIVNSRTYQLSARDNEFNRSDTRYFSHMLARPLPAEVLLDAICRVTGVPEDYEIMKDYIVGIPTEAVQLPLGTRAVQLPVTDIVTLINKSGRYVRYESHPFMRTFGQPNRTQTCECDREQKFSRKQALELIAGPIISAKLAQPDSYLGQLLARDLPDAEILNALCLRSLCRTPTPQAARALLEHVASSGDRRQAWEDVLWTILNSQEFVYQH